LIHGGGAGNEELKQALDCFIRSEAASVLRLDGGESAGSSSPSSSSRLRLQPEDVLGSLPPAPDIGTALLPHVEVPIAQKCQAIATFCSDAMIADKRGRRLDLHVVVGERLFAIRSLEQRHWSARERADTAYFETLRLLGRIVSLVSDVIKTYKVDFQVSYDLN